LAIDIGSAAIDRSTYWTFGYTLVLKNNPANADGSINTIEIWAVTSLSNCEVATFSASGNNLTTRDSEALGSVTSGSKQEFTGLDMDILTGDYLGAYYTAGQIERSNDSAFGLWYKNSDEIPCTGSTFSSSAVADASLYGIGSEGGGATEKQSSDTGAGADTKASGNPLAALSGGETGGGADALPGRDIALPEAGSGVDSLVSLQTPAAKTSADGGSGAESAAIVVAALVDDETGSGADAYVSLQVPQNKTSSDVGSGVEAMPVYYAVLAGSESGSGVEAFIARLLAAAEASYGAEASEIGGGGLLKNLSAGELGEGTDGLTAKIEIPNKGGGMKLWT
jgi:hypothetical protein